MKNKQLDEYFDPLFEFARLKFEVSYHMEKLLTIPGEIDSFKYRMEQLENQLSTWKVRAEKITSSLASSSGK